MPASTESRDRARAGLVAMLLAAVGAVGAGWWQPASAHPLGLPGIVRLEVEGATVRAEWVLASDDRALLADRTKGERAAYDYFAARLLLSADGRPCEPRRAPPGRDAVIAAELRCRRPPRTLEVTSRLLLDFDDRYRTLAVVLIGDRTERRFLGAAGPTAVVTVRGEAARGEELAGDAAPRTGLPSLERRFVGVIEDSSASLAALLAAIAGALVVGAVHALAPGHGKSIAAAYLVGSRGRPRDALLLGVCVSVMHTGSVLSLGFATWYATRSVDPGAVVDVLRAVAAVLVTAVGAYLVVTRTRGGHRHDHDHAPVHGHAHDHADGSAHDHDHAPTPFSRRGMVALGLSGGLLPSPSALVVVLAGIGAGRVTLALALVAAFSVGLAGAVCAVGLLVLRGRDLVADRWAAGAAARWLPLVAAYGVLGLGLVLSGSALLRL